MKSGILTIRLVLRKGYSQVREQSRNNEGSIIIVTADGPKKFEEESTLFRSIDEEQNDPSLEVYAPVVIKDSVEKRKVLAEFSGSLQEIITKLVLEETQKEMGKGTRNED